MSRRSIGLAVLITVVSFIALFGLLAGALALRTDRDYSGVIETQRARFSGSLITQDHASRTFGEGVDWIEPHSVGVTYERRNEPNLSSWGCERQGTGLGKCRQYCAYRVGHSVGCDQSPCVPWAGRAEPNAAV